MSYKDFMTLPQTTQLPPKATQRKSATDTEQSPPSNHTVTMADHTTPPSTMQPHFDATSLAIKTFYVAREEYIKLAGLANVAKQAGASDADKWATQAAEAKKAMDAADERCTAIANAKREAYMASEAGMR